MSWWKTKAEAPIRKEQVKESVEAFAKEYIIDLQSDIKSINRVLNAQQNYIAALEIKMDSMLTRNTDAIELKEAFEKVLNKVGYTKIRPSNPMYECAPENDR